MPYSCRFVFLLGVRRDGWTNCSHLTARNILVCFRWHAVPLLFNPSSGKRQSPNDRSPSSSDSWHQFANSWRRAAPISSGLHRQY